MLASADKRGWGSPPLSRTKITTVRTNGLLLPVHTAIAPIVSWLVATTEARGYDLRPDWSWGYAPRYIAGTTTWSNHAWGLAVDLNAPTNPMKLGTLVTDMPAWMVQLWEAHSFAWGGRYVLRKDPMHFEFAGTPTDAARLVRQVEAYLQQEARPVANAPFVALLVHPDGGYLRIGADGGYLRIGADGGVFAHDTAFHGAAAGAPLNAPIVGAAWTPTKLGYWMVAADGGVFTFGDAAFHGSTGGVALNRPIVAIQGTGHGGYVLVAKDGGVFPFGPGAEFHGAEPLWAG